MRIAVIDLLFNWPPDGGARVDVKEVFSRIARYHELKLFAPKLDNVVSRGTITGDVGFEVQPISFCPSAFNRWKVVERFSTALDNYQPDLVFITDGWHMKPWAAMAARNYPTILRFFAYECLCLRHHGTFMCGSRSCFRSHIGNLLLDYTYCNACALKQMARDVLAGYPGMFYEYIGAMAFFPTYPCTVKTMIKRARAILVYNSLIQSIISPMNSSVHIIPGGINPEQFPQQPFKDKKPFRIGMVGRINDYNKGYGVLREAFVKLLEKNYDVELWLTGKAPETLPELPRVYYKGWFSPETLHHFYADLDICVVPSIWQEPFGIVAVEAMASGKPVIVTRVGGLQHIIQHNITGISVPKLSADQLVEAFELLILNSDLRKRIGEAAAVKARKMYSWDTIVEKYYLPIIEKQSMENW
ncbi:glycosyltransferase family 4 protein [bacterium]|nr:glycosyltransferase family 4 protein [candidate division CSSED10-310 bacterium]